MDANQQLMPFVAGLLPMLGYACLTALAYSFGGWLWESACCSLVAGRPVRRGVLYAPVCPLYGIMALIACHLLPAVGNPALLLLLATVIAFLAEYGISVVSEPVIRRSPWSHDGIPLNARGRACVPSAVAFGILALIARHAVQPVIDPILSSVPPERLGDAGVVLSVLLLVDLAMSARRWDLDDRRVPARVVTAIQPIPEGTVTPWDAERTLASVTERIQDDILLSDLEGYAGGSRLRYHAHRVRRPRIRIVSAKRIAEDRLLVVARVGGTRSVLLAIGHGVRSLLDGANEANDGREIIRRAITTDETDDLDG